MSDLLKEDLVIPIYLNEKIVIDTLAIIENGFSMVSNISTSSSNNESTEKTLEAGASVNGVISRLLRVSFNAEHNQQKENNINETSSTEKVHTLASLFSRLRKYLMDNNMLTTISEETDIGDIKAGDFIEAAGSLEKNPMIKMIEDFIEVSKFSEIFSNEPDVGNRKNQKQQKKKENQMVKQMEGFLKNLKVSGAEDIIMENKISIVLSAQEQYLFKENIYELTGGNFKVLGKVVKVYDKEEVNLFRNTPLALFAGEQFQELEKAFQDDSLKQLNLPEFKTDIQAPALVVIPIAIFI